jgi:CDP-diacylglycerol--serine O-phosphatidyltransferase
MQKRHFSMIRDFAAADLLTLANGFCGMASVLWSASSLEENASHRIWYAMAALPLAAFFDFLDGRVARWRHESTPLGAQLDSLADLISFGVAPAVLAFALGMSGGWDSFVLVYFVACGLSRLARYNVTSRELADQSGAVRYFEGMPIPTSLVLVVVLAILQSRGLTGTELPFGSIRLGPWLFHPVVLMYALSGSAMISKTLRIPKP